MSNDAEYLKKVIRENLLIEVEQVCKGKDIYITTSLRFKGDDKPFANQTIQMVKLCET